MKTVTNLLENIGKIRDLIAEGDTNKIYKNLYLFQKTTDDIKRHMAKYIKNTSYELDFNHEDLKETSDEIRMFLKGWEEKFKYDKYYKYMIERSPIDNEILDTFSRNIGVEMKVDAVLRDTYTRIAFMSIIIDVYSRQSSRKDFSAQITDCIKSLI